MLFVLSSDAMTAAAYRSRCRTHSVTQRTVRLSVYAVSYLGRFVHTHLTAELKMDINALNRELARVIDSLCGYTTERTRSQEGDVPDVVNNAELMEALKRAYDGLYIRRGNLGDPRAYWAEAGFAPIRSSGCGSTAHEALGRAIVEYLKKAKPAN